MKKIKLPISKISFSMINVLIVLGMLLIGYSIFKTYQDIQLNEELIINYLQNSPVDKIETQKAKELLEYLDQIKKKENISTSEIKNPFASLEPETTPETPQAPEILPTDEPLGSENNQEPLPQSLP